LITIENLEEMALPVTVAIKEENGKTGMVKLPAEIWQRGPVWTFPYKSTSKIVLVTIDPDHVLPDVNPDNNSYSGLTVPAGLTAGAVVKSYLDAIGGADKIKGITDLTILSEGTLQGTPLKMTSKYKTPDKFMTSILAPSYNNLLVNHVVMNGNEMSASQVNQPVPITDQVRATLKARFLMFPELNYANGYILDLAPTQQVVGDNLAYLVTVTTPDGIKIKSYFDTKTGLKLKQFIDAPNSTITEYNDYRDVNGGVKIPFDMKTVIIGQPVEFKVTGAVANSGLTDGQFK
jgi:hypothetical protein